MRCSESVDEDRILDSSEGSTNPRLGWPDGAPFALFLSHDIDHIHDRELWRLASDTVRLGKGLISGDSSLVSQTGRRIARRLWAPKRSLADFETILELERQHGFRSTFFVMHDRYWARYGARYRLSDRKLRRIVQLVTAAGCEIGLHGSYYSCEDSESYRQGRMAISTSLGTNAVGVRNHYLRFSGQTHGSRRRRLVSSTTRRTETGTRWGLEMGETSLFGP
jgi:peptidoglycan/xylan/chitin deacetylase (PgdA/CDA1 family)